MIRTTSVAGPLATKRKFATPKQEIYGGKGVRETRGGRYGRARFKYDEDMRNPDNRANLISYGPQRYGGGR